MSLKAPTCQLYLASPNTFDVDEHAGILRDTLDAGDVAAYLLQLPGADEKTVRKTCRILCPIVQDHGAAFLLNNHPEIAAEYDCDGVHFSDPRAHIRDAREILGEDRIIGVYCAHSRHLAMQAGERGADYVMFAPFFSSDGPVVPPNIELLQWWQEMIEIPCVGAGGITPENCPSLIKAGADFLCVGTSVWNHPDGPAAAINLFNSAICECIT